MSSWTQKEKDIVINKSAEGLLPYEICNHLINTNCKRRTISAVRGIVRRNQKKINRLKEDTKNKQKVVHKYFAPPAEDKFSRAIDEMNKIKSKSLNTITSYTKSIGNPKNANFKVLSLSDLHLPFYNEELLNEAINKHSDADVLVLNGDLLELYSVSRWPKSKSIILRHEYQMAVDLLVDLAKIFPKIVLVKGNHEERLQSYFQSNVDPMVSFMTDPDILHRLSEGYAFNDDGELEKMYDFDNVHYNKGNFSWFAQVGRCIFAHPSGGSSVPMKTATKTAEYFLGREANFDALVIGHTHKIGSIVWNNKLLIEQGCSCVPLEYESTSKMAYRPQAFGYAVVYMDSDGNVDFDKSGAVYHGTGVLSSNELIQTNK